MYNLAKKKVKSSNETTIQEGITELRSLYDTALDRDELLYYIALGYKRLGNNRAFYDAISQIKYIDERVEGLLQSPSRTRINSNVIGRIVAVSVLAVLGALASFRSGSN